MKIPRYEFEQTKRTEDLKLIKRLVDLYPAEAIREVEIKKILLQNDNSFGGCSVCGIGDEALNVKVDVYIICNIHKKYWFGPPFDISEMPDKFKKDWDKNLNIINEYIYNFIFINF